MTFTIKRVPGRIDGLASHYRVFDDAYPTRFRADTREQGELLIRSIRDKKNLILVAACCDDVDASAKMIQDALGIETGDLAAHELSAPNDWERKDVWARLDEILRWLKSEIYEFECTVSARTPMETVGTND